jgi:hypothetical protein
MTCRNGVGLLSLKYGGRIRKDRGRHNTAILIHGRLFSQEAAAYSSSLVYKDVPLCVELMIIPIQIERHFPGC